MTAEIAEKIVAIMVPYIGVGVILAGVSLKVVEVLFRDTKMANVSNETENFIETMAVAFYPITTVIGLIYVMVRGMKWFVYGIMYTFDDIKFIYFPRRSGPGASPKATQATPPQSIFKQTYDELMQEEKAKEIHYQKLFQEAKQEVEQLLEEKTI